MKARALGALFVLGVALTGACDEERPEYAATGSNACAVDEDGDGYGIGCPRGPDCNDGDPTTSRDCGYCDAPNVGCECDPGTAPVECMTQELLDHDTLLCKTGTRYCQDGAWSECLGVTSFEAELPRPGFVSQALIDPDAGSGTCSPCRPSCFPVEDPLDVVDGGLDSTNSDDISWVTGGGITVATSNEPSTPVVGSIEDCADVDPGDVDCDNIPDDLDAVNGKNQAWGTIDETLFMDLAPGEQESLLVELPVLLHGVDVYFLLDMSEGHEVVAPALAAALTTGSFITDEASVTCADTDFDGAPNEELKTGGIVGNLACLVRDASFGTGWVREIPFTGPDASGIRYGDADEQLFEHRVDIGDTAAAISAALLDYQIDANQGGPNAPIQALYALATGAESYVGWDRPAVPARDDCAAGGAGYACFRAAAMPVVALFTGAPLYEGPATSSGDLGSLAGVPYPRAYPAAVHQGQVNAGSYAHYLPVPNDNETVATAYPVTSALVGPVQVAEIEDDFLTFTGDTRGMTADIAASVLSCAGLGTATGPDAVFEFEVGSTQELTVSTAGTRFENVLGIIKQPEAGTVATVITEDTSATPGVADTWASALYLGTLPKGVRATLRGNSAGAGADFPREWLGCYEHASFGATDDSTDYGPDVVYRFRVAEDMRLNISTLLGSYAKSVSLFANMVGGLGDWNSAGVDTDTDLRVASSELVNIPQNMFGNAVRLVSGHTGTGAQRSGLPLSTAGLTGDLAGSLFAAAGCTPGSEFSPDAQFEFTIGPGARIRIETSGDEADMAPNFAHMIGLYRVEATPPSALIACGQDNLVPVAGGEPMARSFIEQTLPTGTYRIVVRGVSAGDAGNYRLTVRDVGIAPNALDCHVNAEGAPTSFEHTLTACKTGFTAPCPGNEQEYTLVMRGFDASDAQGGDGAYEIQLRDTDLGGTIDVCGLSGVANSYTGEFSPGTYTAIVKGITAADAGWYQLSMGDATLATPADLEDLRSWDTEVRGELQVSGVRVLGVQLGSDAALSEQLATVANETQALSSTSTPLVVAVDPASAQLTQAFGQAVVGSVQELAAGANLDVSVRLVESPDAPSPGFIFSAAAEDQPDDGCGTPVNDVHMDCVQGAHPGFRVQFQNPPAPGNVPPNPDDPNGGYWMTLELVGDGRYVLESIPVYIVPSDVAAEPVEPLYAAEGTYFQDFGAQNCDPNERPDWDTLEWSAELPPGTTLVWEMCLAETRDELDGCTMDTLASVTPGEPCASSADCPNGYCHAGTCHFAVGPECENDVDCGRNGVCVADLCRWTALPIDPYPLAKGGERYVRLQARLQSDLERTVAPAVYQWRMEYECGHSE